MTSSDRWEMGSEQHWDDTYVAAVFSSDNFPTDHYAVFATARAAMGALAETLGIRGARLHLPSYFCPTVSRGFAEHFNIAWYQDNPMRQLPVFSSIQAKPGDVLLAVNYFGMRPKEAWREWIECNRDVVVIEDLSHDPSRERALGSPAHYVLTSLRKTLPIPDGALVYSPTGLPIPDEPCSSRVSAMLEAMVLKGMYLRGLHVAKRDFLALYRDGNRQIVESGVAGPSLFTRAVLPRLKIQELLTVRRQNVHFSIDADLTPVQRGWFSPLFTDWPHGGCPFNYVVYAHDGSTRDALRRHLIDNNVYPAIHWSQEGALSSFDPKDQDLSNRLLTIPVDHRYDHGDMLRLAEILDSFRV